MNETEWDKKRKWFPVSAVPMPNTMAWRKFSENGPWVKLAECPVALVTYHLCEVMEVKSNAIEYARCNDFVYDMFVTPSLWVNDSGNFWSPQIKNTFDPYRATDALIAFMPHGVNLG